MAWEFPDILEREEQKYPEPRELEATHYDELEHGDEVFIRHSYNRIPEGTFLTVTGKDRAMIFFVSEADWEYGLPRNTVEPMIYTSE